MGGSAGAAAAAATTPLDVVKTRMMCSASTRPTFMGAVRSIAAEGDGFRAFFRGVGPRALSNGINSAVFFCFFEAIRRVLVARQQGEAAVAVAATGAGGSSSGSSTVVLPVEPLQDQAVHMRQRQQQVASWQGDLQQQGAAGGGGRGWQQQGAPVSGNAAAAGGEGGRSVGGDGGRLACLSLALPVPQFDCSEWF